MTPPEPFQKIPHKDLLTVADLASDEVQQIFSTAAALKADPPAHKENQYSTRRAIFGSQSVGTSLDETSAALIVSESIPGT